MATTWFPEHIGTNDYKGLAIEITALAECGVIDRFASVREMADWLTQLLGWEVEVHAIRRAITRFRSRDTQKEEPEKYLYLLDFYRQQTAEYHEIKRKIMAEMILGSKGVNTPENKQ